MREQTYIFALDIGTRSVVGVLGVMDGDVFRTVDYEQRYHRHGTMRDGQVEDIAQAAIVAREVKEALEERNGCKLDRAAVAAAGRSLHTVRASFEQDVPQEPLSQELIRAVEYGALSAAIEQLTETASNKSIGGDFSCVGYNVIAYWLDEYQYRSLEGQQGRRVRVELIAAFLPFSVVRSLYAVVERCGLKVDSLTLEPIAAINAIVPADIRLLNIAITDIGAGTSDIAISRNGSIVAYDMATIAGDELTEVIMQQCLTDFDTAERIKKEAGALEEKAVIEYNDILGVCHQSTAGEMRNLLADTTDALCQKIADSILAVNQTAPVAVFLVGGGSLFPGLRQGVAGKLGIPEERVAIGGTQPYKYISLCSDALQSPEFVTPLGIGASYRYTKGDDFFSIMVNDQKIMFPHTVNSTVLDALLIAGIKASELIGKTPPPLSFTVNGEKRTVRSTPATPGELYINGSAAALNSAVHQGDRITVVFAKGGTRPEITVGDLLTEYGVGSHGQALVNGEPGDPQRKIVNGDQVEIPSLVPEPEAETESTSASSPVASSPQIAVVVDGPENGGRDHAYAGNGASVPDEGGGESQQGNIQGESPKGEASQSKRRSLRLCLNGVWGDFPAEEGPLHFVDMLNHVDIDPGKPEGDLILKLNGKEAAYTAPLSDGDSVEIGWDREKGLGRERE